VTLRNDGTPAWYDTRAIESVDWEDEERRLAEALRAFWASVGEAAWGLASDQLGVAVAWDLANPNVRRLLDFLASREDGPVGMTRTTREDVAGVVGDALEEGASLDELARRLTGLFEETYRGRAETIARTESQVAYNLASAVGYAESGVVSMAELADNPNHTEGYNASDGLTCAERDGLIVPLDRVPRHVAAEHPNGSLAVLPVLSRPLGEG
jgi:hypothetical protein